jgi:hypothetical protein
LHKIQKSLFQEFEDERIAGRRPTDPGSTSLEGPSMQKGHMDHCDRAVKSEFFTDHHCQGLNEGF